MRRYRCQVIQRATVLIGALLMSGCALLDGTSSTHPLDLLGLRAAPGTITGHVEQVEDEFVVVQVTRSDGFGRSNRSPRPPRITIRDGRQEPALALVAPGETFQIVNRDRIHHDLFTVDATSPIDLGLGPGVSAPLQITQPGLLRAYCRMHPQEHFAFLVARADHHAFANGSAPFEIAGLRPGSYRVRATALDGSLDEMRVDVAPGKRTTIVLHPTAHTAR